MRKHFDRTIGGEGKLIKREKADRERGISGFWGYDWNKVYIGYCDGASFGGVMMIGMMMGILFSRSVDVHVDKCLHFCRGAPKLCGVRRVRSSVYRHTVKGILMNFLHFGRVQLEYFNGVSERHHVLYWIYLCGVFACVSVIC